jgi:hypothetical protein
MSVFFSYYLSLRSYVRVFSYYLSLRSYVRVFSLLFVFTFLCPYLHTKIGNGVRLKTQLYAKRNDFIFPMIKRPFIISNILASLRSYVRVFSLLFVFTFLCPCFFPIICLYFLISVL